jgi:hypothetical protein
LCADAGDLDNERTMSDADRGRTSDEAAIWSSRSPLGFERQPASWPLPLRRALAERFPAHIDGGRFAPLVDRSKTARHSARREGVVIPHLAPRTLRRQAFPHAPSNFVRRNDPRLFILVRIPTPKRARRRGDEPSAGPLAEELRTLPEIAVQLGEPLAKVAGPFCGLRLKDDRVDHSSGYVGAGYKQSGMDGDCHAAAPTRSTQSFLSGYDGVCRHAVRVRVGRGPTSQVLATPLAEFAHCDCGDVHRRLAAIRFAVRQPLRDACRGARR